MEMEKNIELQEIKSKHLIYYQKYMLFIGIFGQLMFFLQGVKIFQNQSAADVSIGGFSLGFITVFSWLIYGILVRDKVLIISNLFAVIGAGFVILGILIHGKIF